jgi:putative membrane-bound dehydrogenase-like protein
MMTHYLLNKMSRSAGTRASSADRKKCLRPYGRRAGIAAGVLGILGALLVGPVGHAAEPVTKPAQSGGPVAASDGPGTLLVPDELEATLFAAEPLLSSPTNIDIDARGRVWVCEVMNYRGRKDHRPAGDRILVLEDTDGDGSAETSRVFYQGRDVDSALGICVIGDGPGMKVIVSCAPDVWVFHDDDGDLVADRKEALFTKTGQPQHDHSVHAFSVGPDGRWYFNFGNTGNAVHDSDGKPVVDLLGNVVSDAGRPYRQGMVFRCRPDGSAFEVLGHNFRNNYEVAVDSFGSLWQSDNDDDGNQGVRINFVLEGGNYGYVDERTGQGWQVPRTNMEAEIPLRHWHQNDPGVVPNLLLTGAGSPTGICVYEGDLLPQRFSGSLIHCDAGPNIVRAYHLQFSGAGYKAQPETVADGAADRWFRPSDVCVAPDGSLIVADWYDPGVGGHGMGDTEKGRLYRIAPKGSRWTVPPVDFSTVAGAVAALASPNLSTRATALERLAQNPAAAEPILAAAFHAATNPRLAARLAWARGMVLNASETSDIGARQLATRELLKNESPDLRIVGLRLVQASGGDLLAAAEQLAADPSAAVRREVAVSLRGVAGERADLVWADLAAAHTPGDRWDTEALGIGATGQENTTLWDARLAAWRRKVGEQWKNQAGREIVWRSRAGVSAHLIGTLLLDPNVTSAESLALLRALDFQPPHAREEALREVVIAADLSTENNLAADDKLRLILPEILFRLDPAAGSAAGIAEKIAAVLAQSEGTQRFVELVGRFQMTDRRLALVALAADPTTSDALATSALATALDLGAEQQVRLAINHPEEALATADLQPSAAETNSSQSEKATRLLALCGLRGKGPALAILIETSGDAAATPDLRAAAVRGLARSEPGARKLVELAREGQLGGSLQQAAASAVSACPWGDVRKAAAEVLPLPPARGGQPLPAVAELLKRSGNAEQGRGLFTGVGSCAKCHVVRGEGKMVGPDLTGIGAKLSREALYESILAPSAAISHGYEAWTALTSDGRSLSGLLVSRSPEQVVIRGSDGLDTTLETAELEELVRQPVSLMPADLASTLSADELTDIVAWLETLRGGK